MGIDPAQLRSSVVTAAALATALRLLTEPSAAPVAAADLDCRDFRTHEEAQAYFEARGGSRTNNVDRLDEDRDGIACELLPRGGTVPRAPIPIARTPTPSPARFRPTPTPDPDIVFEIGGWGFTSIGALVFGVVGAFALYLFGAVAWGMLADRRATGGFRSDEPSGPTRSPPVQPPSRASPPGPSPGSRTGYNTRTMPYPEYLQTPEWFAKRTAALRRASYRCQLCNRTGRLEVHHRTYARRGHEAPEDLIVLCNACHGAFHQRRDTSR